MVRTLLRAFTLIELLIVVAIIAILEAIAVPNFLESQIRAKVSRTKADIRSMVTALEAYRADNNSYPSDQWITGYPGAIGYLGSRGASVLSTPIAYMSSIPMETAFGDWRNARGGGTIKMKGYLYWGGEFWGLQIRYPATTGWKPLFYPEYWQSTYVFSCNGPYKTYGNYTGPLEPYDPSNGTVSIGEIMYMGGAPGGMNSFH